MLFVITAFGGPVIREVLSELLVFYGLKFLGKRNGYV